LTPISIHQWISIARAFGLITHDPIMSPQPPHATASSWKAAQPAIAADAAARRRDRGYFGIQMRSNHISIYRWARLNGNPLAA
jgi:hypothetical protein